jgi:hypothetical protein
VLLPVSLGAREREFWRRMIGNIAIQLEAYGASPRPIPGVELIDGGPPLPPVPLGGERDRVAISFSSGKDSLVLTGLAAELTRRPLLVMVNSPVRWARDQVGPARQHSASEIVGRLPVELVQVQSDYRSSWELGFSARDGCAFGVHELSDIALYQAATAAAAVLHGCGGMLMASEADLQHNELRAGRVVLGPDPLSCAVIQGSIDALLRRFDLRQSSLTYALHTAHTHTLLMRRYPDLADLVFSCWQADGDARWCNACEKCFAVTMATLAEGCSPRALGIDAVAVLCAFGDWRLDKPRLAAEPVHAVHRTRHRIVRGLQETPTARVAELVGGAGEDRRLGEALAVYARMRAQALARIVPPAPGYIDGFVEFAFAEHRAPLRSIFDEHFAPTTEFEETVQRARSLIDWIGAPLAAERALHS